MPPETSLVAELTPVVGDGAVVAEETRDHVPTCWVRRGRVKDALRHLKHGAPRPYRMLYDLTAVDERDRTRRNGAPKSDFTVVYHLLSLERNEYARLKV